MKKVLIIFSILIVASLFVINPALADSGVFEGISSCMKLGNCSLCGIVSVFVNIGRWILSVMGGIALVYFVWAGISLILSFGNSERVANARKMVINSILGIAIILGAWTLVNFIFVGFIANNTNGVVSIWKGQAPWSTVAGMCENLEPTVATINTTTNSLPDVENEAQMRAKLSSLGVTVNKNPCKVGQTSDCTDLAGMKPETVGAIMDLANRIGGQNVIVTGGTEDMHASGIYSHVNGYKFDLRLNSAVEQHILDNVKGYYFRSDKTRVYIVDDGTTYAEYARESDHWDVCVDCKKS